MATWYIPYIRVSVKEVEYSIYVEHYDVQYAGNTPRCSPHVCMLKTRDIAYIHSLLWTICG